jgi:cobalt-zinc-cadmium resistance protein CzcA
VLFLFLLNCGGADCFIRHPSFMLFAIAGMIFFDVSANLMSLGAIDFCLIVDAAVIMVENSVRRLAEARHAAARPLTRDERLDVIRDSSSGKAASRGDDHHRSPHSNTIACGHRGDVRPMHSPSSWHYPALWCSARIHSGLSARDHKKERETFLSRILAAYEVPALNAKHPLAYSRFCFCRVHLSRQVGLSDHEASGQTHQLKSVSLGEAVRQTTQIERVLKSFPEVTQVVSRIGRPEIATDPMGPDMGDTYVFLKPHSEWRAGMNHEELLSEMSDRLKKFPGVVASFSQPIKFRMMELIEGIGSRSDVVIKIFGDDLDALRKEGDETAGVLRTIRGAEDVKVQQITGLPMLQVHINRDAIARYGINVSDVQEVIQSAIAGTRAPVCWRAFDALIWSFAFPSGLERWRNQQFADKRS